MAFIRWKKLKHGTLKAYLVHSYRDEQGRPRHKTLAYLGAKADLDAGRLENIKARHGHLSIKWDKIKPSSPPKQTDIGRMNDVELLQNMRSLRREYGISVWRMQRLLERAGAPRSTGKYKDFGLSRKEYLNIEHALADGGDQDFYEDPVRDLVPALRKVLSSA